METLGAGVDTSYDLRLGIFLSNLYGYLCKQSISCNQEFSAVSSDQREHLRHGAPNLPSFLLAFWSAKDVPQVHLKKTTSDVEGEASVEAKKTGAVQVLCSRS